MVTPKIPVNKPSSRESSSTTTTTSSNQFIVVAVKILFVLLILLLLPRLVTSKKRQSTKERTNRNRLDCEVDCSEYIPEESMNCIFQCMSEECYFSVYGGDNIPLEPGEVDVTRMDKFRLCVEVEIKRARRQPLANTQQGTVNSGE
jgi:hypothetical protein